MEPMSVQITERAAARVKQFMASDENAVGLRFGVKRTGCSGWMYVVDLAGDVAEDDRVFEGHGVKVVVDAKSLPLVDGTEIDFVDEGINKTFQFHNPNVADACGCGESFAIETH